MIFLLACTAGPGADKADDNHDDTATDTGKVPDGPTPAALTEPSSGACPDMSKSGTTTFTSSGVERQVSIVVPSNPQPGMAVSFFFHGLTAPGHTDNPGGETAAGLGLQSIADDTNTLWIAPDAPIQNLYNMYEVYLWDLALDTDADLVLFDDLRTCAARAHDVDLYRVSAFGFSGGALFTTLVLGHRSDALAAGVAMSGGSDLEIPGEENLWSAYTSPIADVPVLLTTGGETDVWPSTAFVVVDFVAATDTLEAELVADEHVVVRCRDERGHTMTNPEWSFARTFAEVHRFGEASPYAEGDLGEDANGCLMGGTKK